MNIFRVEVDDVIKGNEWYRCSFQFRIGGQRRRMSLVLKEERWVSWKFRLLLERLKLIPRRGTSGIVDGNITDFLIEEP